jgi:hypothetical protein
MASIITETTSDFVANEDVEIYLPISQEFSRLADESLAALGYVDRLNLFSVAWSIYHLVLSEGDNGPLLQQQFYLFDEFTLLNFLVAEYLPPLWTLLTAENPNDAELGVNMANAV